MKWVGQAEQPINLFVVLLGSAAGNLLLWFGLSHGSSQSVKVVLPPELVFDRVVIDKKDKSIKPVFHPIKPKPLPKVEPKKEEPERLLPKPPPPEGAHNRFLTAPTKNPVPDDHFVVPSGGNAKLGAPTDGQRSGNGVENPPKPPPPAPPVTPTTAEPTKTAVTAPPPAPPAPPVKHEEPPAAPPAPPKPKGESREAKPDHQESVEIPESLKSQSFKSFVRVRVEISADGKFKVVLRTSSGNADVDKLVLDTLNKWTWKPALKDGEAVDSVQQFRFNFSIE